MKAGGTIREWTRRFVGRATPPTMGMVLGAHACRCIASGNEGPIFSEPSVLWREKDGKKILLEERSIGAVAEETLICRNPEDYEFVGPIQDESTLDPYTLGCILRYFRSGLARAAGCRLPRYLVATGRPPLLGVLRPILGRAAREAGFRGCETVEEQRCLAAAWQWNRSPKVRLFVDIGEVGTRAHALRNGDFLEDSFATSEIGGERMLEFIVEAIGEDREARIGRRLARRLLHLSDDVTVGSFEVRGRDRSSGRPRTLLLERAEVLAALSPLFEAITDTCHESLRRAGVAEGDDFEIFLAGGAARSAGLSEVLESRLQCPVRLEAAPEEMSIRGLARLIAAEASIAAP